MKFLKNEKHNDRQLLQFSIIFLKKIMEKYYKNNTNQLINIRINDPFRHIKILLHYIKMLPKTVSKNVK